jgi:hypothetical protein
MPHQSAAKSASALLPSKTRPSEHFLAAAHFPMGASETQMPDTNHPMRQPSPYPLNKASPGGPPRRRRHRRILILVGLIAVVVLALLVQYW